MTKADWLRSEIEKLEWVLEESKNTFFNDWNDEKEKLDDGASKEDAVRFIEKIIPLTKTCPFCGKVPVFTYSVGKRDASGYVGHFTKREGCCDATGMGKTELFFCSKDKSENYGLWAKQMFWQIQKWNERTNNQALTSIITRYKEELKVLDDK